MLRKLKIYTLFFILACCSSCIQEIPFENKSTLNRINISGQYTDQLEDQVIEIREVSNLSAESTIIGNPIEFATVYIQDNDGITTPFQYQSQGKYLSRSKGIVGKSYKLFIQIQNGKKYESSFHKIIENAPIDSLRADPYISSVINSNGTVISDKRVVLMINTILHNSHEPINTVYRITGIHEFQEEDNRISPPLRTCFITQNFDFGNIVAFAGNELPGNKLAEARIINVAHDTRFSYTFCFEVDQFAVDFITYEYWKNVQKITNLKRSVFDPPPGHLTSNITCTTNPDDVVFGYFTVGSKTTKRTFTNSTKLGFPAQYFCRGGSIVRKPPECVDCRLFSNSSTVRPSFWPF